MQDESFKRKGLLRIISLLTVIAAIVVFLLTEAITSNMVFADGWTILMVIIAAVQVVIAIFSRKKNTDKARPNYAKA